MMIDDDTLKQLLRMHAASLFNGLLTRGRFEDFMAQAVDKFPGVILGRRRCCRRSIFSWLCFAYRDAEAQEMPASRKAIVLVFSARRHVQREILQQVEALKRDFGFAVLFITHDLSLLLEFADRIAIMYAGEVVETAPAERLGANPQHPYTQGLMKSFPPLSGPLVPLTGIPGSPPDLRDPPTGCRFHPRCPHCVPEQAELYRRQTSERPKLRVVEEGHEVACHLVAEAME